MQDEDAGVTPDEGLNGFQTERMILNPGGCATYIFPVENDQTFAFIIPARKPGLNGYEVRYTGTNESIKSYGKSKTN